MGSGQSRLNKAEAQALAGNDWNEELFDTLPLDSKGTVSRKTLVKLLHLPKVTKTKPKGTIAAESSDSQPVADLATTDSIPDTPIEAEESPTSGWKVITPVPLATRFGTHIVTKGTKDLLADVGGKERIVAMVTRFYNKAFEDQHLDRFIARHDDPHGERLGLWIAEKMGDPDGNVWTNSRPPNARQLAHRDAWHSPKREPEKHGRRFKLDDCRVWMRLMFWACREEGLMDHPAFGTWFVQFIGHFIAVYERSAPPYAQESADWSAHEANIQRYRDNNYLMTDVVA